MEVALIHEMRKGRRTYMNLFTKLLILSLSIVSIQTHADITDGEVDLKVQSRVGRTYIGVLQDGRMAAVVCTKDFFGGWSADLVFSVKQDGDKVPEMTLESYRATRLNFTGRRSPFLELTSEAAAQFCQNPAKEFVFKVNADRMAVVARTGSPVTLEASADR
jgi:hypothetical protein